MSRIFIFGGTTEGRQAAQRLVRAGHRVTVSVATELGAEALADIGPLTVLVGRLEPGEMAEHLRDMDCCIDATHPYAVQASRNIAVACESTGTPLRRLLRCASDTTGAVAVSSPEAAGAYLAGQAGNVLLTIGTKALPAFAGLDLRRVYVRTLPTHEALYACEGLGLPHRNILALQGPFSTELNLAILRQYHIRWLVTKDGGSAGGMEEKLEAARLAGAQVILIRRPEEQGVDFETLMKEMLG